MMTALNVTPTFSAGGRHGLCCLELPVCQGILGLGVIGLGGDHYVHGLRGGHVSRDSRGNGCWRVLGLWRGQVLGRGGRDSMHGLRNWDILDDRQRQQRRDIVLGVWDGHRGSREQGCELGHSDYRELCQDGVRVRQGLLGQHCVFGHIVHELRCGQASRYHGCYCD